MGDRLRIGETSAVVSGVLLREPDRSGNLITIGPRVMVRTTGVDDPPRCSVRITGVPVTPRIRLLTWLTSMPSVEVLSIRRIRSKSRTPACSAGLPGITEVT